jgi:hypothetical protein
MVPATRQRLLWALCFMLSFVLSAGPSEALALELEPVAGKKDKPTKEEKSEAEKKAEEEEERKKRELYARAIVIPWLQNATSADHRDEGLQRVVRSAISRSEAMFFPEVDLYQNGRRKPDRTLAPTQQPAYVSDTAGPQIMAEVSRVAAIGWNAIEPNQWDEEAVRLHKLTDLIWFVDRVELREPLFLLYAQIGRAATNSNTSRPPFFEAVGGIPVNYYYYLAALLAYQEPALMSKLTDQDVVGDVQFQLDRLQQGIYPSFKGDFALGGQYNGAQFVTDYELYINGIPAELDGRGQMDLFLGRTDVYLKRNDSGHGLAERLESDKLDEKTYFFLEEARKKIGIEFVNQLFLDKNACIPEVDGDILTYLAIYHKLHPKADLFIAVPESGNANKTYIWKYIPESGILRNITVVDTFPVRFALLFSSGIMWNGANYAIDDDVEDETSLAPNDVANANRVQLGFDPAQVPFNFELRGHYNRLMVNMGAEFSLALAEKKWAEYYQTPGKQDQDKIRTVESGPCETDESELTPIDDNGDGKPDRYQDVDGNIRDPQESCVVQDVYNVRQFNRNLWLGAGVVFGRNAAIGFGPRLAARFGWVNMSHSFQTTLHFGWSFQPPIPEGKKRVRPLIDIDARGGVGIARARSLQMDLAEVDDEESRVKPVVGLTLGVGLTF